MSSALATDRWPLVGRRNDLERFAAALADGTHDGVVLLGHPGVGKTRLAEECRVAAERSGHRTARAVASRTAAAVPLGALAHLLPARFDPDAPVDPIVLFQNARRAVEDASDGASSGRLVLVIDDMHLLDGTSAMLVAQLLASGLVFLVGTVRSGEDVPDAVSSLWRDERVVRVDLQALGRTSVDTLLHRALGGPLDAAALEALWASSHGSPLVLRELAAGAIATGTLREVDGVWRLDGPLPSTNRLVELVEARLATVDADERTVLELLAWCEPVGRSDLVAAGSDAALEALNARGLVRLARDGRRDEVTLAHPLYGEVLRARQPVLAARRLLVEHAQRIEAHGARRREDALRVTTWRLDAGSDLDPRRLLDACRLARHAHDFRQVARLAEAAWTIAPSVEAGLLLGEARYELGSFVESEEVLLAAAELARTDDDVLGVAAARSRNLFWGLLSFDDALAVNRAAAEAVGSDDVRDQLVVDEASLLMFSGHPADALRRLDDLAQADTPRGRVERAIVAAPALALGGATRRAVEVARQGFADHQELGDLLVIAHPGTHVVNEVLALTEAGLLDDAVTLANVGYEISVAQGVPITQIWFALNLGRVSLIRGLPESAQRWLRVGLALARATGFDGPREMALRGLAVARAYVGDAPGAREVVDEIDAMPATLGFMAPEADLAHAWACAVEGDVAGARAVLQAGARAAIESGHHTSAAWLLHDVARLGDAPAALDLIEGLAAECDGALVAARARHVRGAARSDAEELAGAVDDLEALGLVLAAAEAATAAADAFRRRGETRSASAMVTRAAALARECEEARTPGLVAADAVVPLSRREREIALLAADGVASKEIAARLYLSVRTVNNHLQNAYTKLGVTGRAELRDALRLAGDDGTASDD